MHLDGACERLWGLITSVRVPAKRYASTAAGVHHPHLEDGARSRPESLGMKSRVLSGAIVASETFDRAT